MIAVRGVYISLRYYFEYKDETDQLVAKALVPTIGMILINYITFDMDEEINKLLNTRFHNSQAMWFKSLRSMPIGVLIYDIEAKKVIFENSQLKSMVED